MSYKILQINSVCGRQSTGKIVTDLQKYIIAEGGDCRVAYGEKNSFPVNGDYHIGTEPQRYLHALSTRLFDNHGLCSASATRGLIKFIKNYEPDIIHLHNIHGYYLNYPMLFEFMTAQNIPAVWTMHDCWAVTGHCAHFDYIGCDKWKTGCYKCVQKNEYPASFTDRSERNYKLKKKYFTMPANLTVVTPSDWLAKIIKQSYLNKYPVYTIPNGIRTEVFRPVTSDIRHRYSISEDKKVILGVCNVWSFKKGFYDFIKLAGILPDEYIVVMIGLGEKQIMQLKGTNIIALPSTDNMNDLVKWYSTADYFVNPTYEDTFPTVNLEALACGTPVITYKTGGSTECLAEECSATVLKGSIKEMADVIIRNKFDKNKCVLQSQKYDYKKCFSSYNELYKKILSTVSG